MLRRIAGLAAALLLFILSGGLLLAPAGCEAAKKVPPPPDGALKPSEVVWSQQKDGLSVTVAATDDLNFAYGSPLGITICLYQLSDMSKFTALAATFDGVRKLLEGDIELLDNNRRQILVYDSAGSYKRSLSLPFMPFGFAKSGAGDYWFYNNNLVSDISRHRLVRYDTEAGRVTGEHFPIDDHVAGYFFVVDDNNFAVSDGSLYYMASPSDTLYWLGEKVSPVYRLGLDKYRVPADFWKANYSDIMEFVTAANSHDYVYSITNFSLNPQAIMVSFMLKDRLYWSFYSVVEGKAYTAGSLYDDFHFTESLALSPASMTYVMDDECLYCLMSSDQFLELAENAKSPVIENLIRQYDVTEQSNPILMKCRLKVD